MAIDAIARGIAGAAQVGLAKANEKIDRLEGKTTRLLYAEKTNPTASEIGTFVDGLGYTSPYEGIAVVVASTYHIWHYYENDNIGWRDDGVDTITPFTNQLAGSILGSTDVGKISANQDGTGSVNGLPVITSTGRSTTRTWTINDPSDVDSHGNPIDRTNTVEGAFSTALGSRNNIASTATESAAIGGKNTVSGEDSFVCGYQNTATKQQSFTGGYNNINGGKESFVFGNTNSLATNAQDSGVVGSTNTVGLTYHSFIVGKNHSIGDAVENTIVSGYQSVLGSGIYGSAIFGNYNEAGADSGYNGVFGAHNSIVGGVTYSFVSGSGNVCGYGYSNLIGWGLKDKESGQTIVGGYNADTTGAWFQVGTGSDNNHRRTSFAVLSDRVTFPTYSTIGDYGATTQYVSNYVTNVVGDINSALDAINGTVI